MTLSKDDILWIWNKLEEAEKSYFRYWETFRKGKKKKFYHLDHIEYEYLFLLDHWELNIELSFEEWMRLDDLITSACVHCLNYGLLTERPTDEWHDDLLTDYILEHL